MTADDADDAARGGRGAGPGRAPEQLTPDRVVRTGWSRRRATTELSADLARAVAILEARRAAAARFQADAIERLPRVRTMAEASYRAGQGSIVELLDALDAITEAQLRDIDGLQGPALIAPRQLTLAARGVSDEQLMHRMVKREPGEGATSRSRMLPLHLAMEGFLALHFNGPEGCLALGYQYFYLVQRHFR